MGVSIWRAMVIDKFSGWRSFLFMGSLIVNVVGLVYIQTRTLPVFAELL